MIEQRLARRMKSMRRSVIRELLKLVNRPEIISFGGGMPDPTLFPVNTVRIAAEKVLEKYGKKVLQYSPTEGHEGLRQEIANWLKKREGVELTPEEILPTNASQQGLDLLAKIFLDPGDIILLSAPTYLGALSAFRQYEANLVSIPLDDNGMQVDLLEEKIKQLDKKGKLNRVKFIYLVPDFQNPSGVTLTLERRKRIIELACEYDLLIVEDTPYRDLRYSGEPVPCFMKLAPKGRVISLFTFSKILFPGLRVGYVVASPDIIDKFVVAKQATDLCSPAFNQAIVCEIMRMNVLSEHIKRLIIRYRDKRDAMLAALNRHMPAEDVSWTKPEGGLFLWVRVPEYLDTTEMFNKALENNVAYIIGSAFYPDDSGKNTMRLNFSYPTLKLIEEGIRRLAQVVKDEIAAHSRRKGAKCAV